jgi:hypothetical protein
MAWKLEGTYFENCSCEVPCPCTVSFDMGADYDRCRVLLAFHIDSGEIEGVDVSGLTVAAVADTPKVMTDGDWKLGMLVDEAASDEQREKLAAVFGGQMGGPMEILAPLIGEMLGVEGAPIDFADEDGRHRLRIGDSVEVEVEDVVPFGVETGEPVKLTDAFHPANSTLTIARATKSRVSALGLEFANEGKSAFSSTFSWSG